MKTRRANSREKILAAAADVAQRNRARQPVAGCGRQPRRRVERRPVVQFPDQGEIDAGAGGGLSARIRASAGDPRTTDGRGESPLAAYIRLSADECEKTQQSASWIFSAIAEDPDFLTPITSFKRQLFERLKGETPDLKALMICYLAIEGLRSMNLFDSDVLSQDERRLLVSSLLEIAR